MTLLLALQGILPLLVFAVVDIFAGLRAALIAAVVIALAEVGWSYYAYGEIDTLSWVSLGLVVIMGGISFYMKNDRLFKFQPVVLGIVSAATLLYFQWLDDPLLLQMMPKVALMFPEEERARFTSPAVIAKMRQLDSLLVGALLMHAGLVAWAAIKKTTFVWLVVRGAGFYVILALTLLLNAVLPTL